MDKFESLCDEFDEMNFSPYLAYHVDVVMLIDATGSMSGLIDKVKNAALCIAPMIVKKMNEFEKVIKTLRIKVISFRDFAYDAEEDAMKESTFFSLPEQECEFVDFINHIEARGGGDIPENALEAICLAMRSNWDVESLGMHRHVILLFTDAPAVPLDDDSVPIKCLRKRKDNPHYPDDIPKTFDELKEWWSGEKEYGMPKSRTKRMILFAPECEPWNRIASNFDFVWPVIAKDNNGCDEFDIEAACDVIAHCC